MSGRGDDALELLVHALVAVAGHDETLVLELLGDVAGAGARHLDPRLGEEGAGAEHVDDIGSGVDGVEERVLEVERGRHVVDEAGGGVELRGAVLGLPDTEEADEEVLGEARVQHLADEEDVGGQGRLQHDGHVGRVEEADGVRAAGATLARRLDGDLDAEALEVDDGDEDEDGGEQVHDVGQVLPVEGLLQGTLLVGPGHEEVEEGDDGALELGAAAGVDGGRGEGLPHDGLADQLVEQDDNHAGDDELEDEEEDDAGAEVGGRAVEAGEDVDGGGTGGEDEGEELLGRLVELAVRLEVEVDVDHVGAGEELEDHARRDDGGDAQLHERTAVTGDDHAQPVQRVRVVRGDDAVQGHLAHDEEDEERQGRPHHLLVEGDLGLRLLDLGEERHERLDQVKESYYRRKRWRASASPFFRRNVATMAARKPVEPLLVVLGSTGTGKSDLAVELATRFGGEVINADAMQLYHGLPIITNKITPREQRGVPHHLLGHIGPDEAPWDVEDFKREATRVMAEIRARGNLPILVGGTQYYVDPLLFADVILDDVVHHDGGDDDTGKKTFPILEEPTDVLLEELRKCDPIMADRWHPNDRRKIQRSLEIFLHTGTPASRLYDEQRARRAAAAQEAGAKDASQAWEKLLFWVDADREVLRARLDARVDKMLDAGLLAEVRELYDFKRDKTAQGARLDMSKGIWQSIGYKQFEPYLAALDRAAGSGVDGQVSAADNHDGVDDDLEALKAKAIEDMKTATRRYANYQTRWIRLKQMRRLRDEGPAALRSLYLVDSTDAARFQDCVVAPAAEVAARFLAGDPLPDPVSLSDRARDVLSAAAAAAAGPDSPPVPETPARRTCDLCGTVCVTEQAWLRHVKGAAHRRVMKKRKKLALVPVETGGQEDERGATPPSSPDIGSLSHSSLLPCSSPPIPLLLNLGLDPLLEASPCDNLLHVGGQLADLLAPRLAVTLRDDDLAAAHVPEELPAGAAGELRLRLLVAGALGLEDLAQALGELGHLNTHERVVDAVARKDVAEAAGDDEGDLLGEDGRRGLLPRRAAAKVEARDEDVAGACQVAELGVVVLHAHLGHLLRRHVVLRLRLLAGSGGLGCGGCGLGPAQVLFGPGDEGLGLGDDLVQRILDAQRLVGLEVAAALADDDLADAFGLLVPAGAGDVSLEGAGGDDFGAGEICLGVRRAHAALEVAVTSADADLAGLEQAGSESNAGAAARGKSLRASFEQNLPVARLLGSVLLGERRGGNVEVDAVGNLGDRAVLGGLAEDLRGGSDIRRPRVGARHQVSPVDGNVLRLEVAQGRGYLDRVGSRDEGRERGQVKVERFGVGRAWIGTERILHQVLDALVGKPSVGTGILVHHG
ncbi:tRNA isopentenyltransferase [Purpureocillium lavendulum]|uniref:tRNA dimethylallyltransferase n=1 Tax=Purpureocillium lavendulum TaxID=1247861 RepID=A0AB34FLR7_9HYPO|nr:tRNA isopentenyltransferase [Purpureocillium lavendulum]